MLFLWQRIRELFGQLAFVIDLWLSVLGVDGDLNILKLEPLTNLERLVQDRNRAVNGHQPNEGDFTDRDGQFLLVEGKVGRELAQSLGAPVLGCGTSAEFDINVLLVHGLHQVT